MGDFLRKVFDDHHLNRASVARAYGVQPQSLNDTFNRQTIGDDVLAGLSRATKLDIIAMVRQAMAATVPAVGSNMVQEPPVQYGRSSTDMEGLKLTVRLEEYDEATQLQIIRYLQQLPKRLK